jgi:hypothetical protein
MTAPTCGSACPQDPATGKNGRSLDAKPPDQLSDDCHRRHALRATIGICTIGDDNAAPRPAAEDNWSSNWRAGNGLCKSATQPASIACRCRSGLVSTPKLTLSCCLIKSDNWSSQNRSRPFSHSLQCAGSQPTGRQAGFERHYSELDHLCRPARARRWP